MDGVLKFVLRTVDGSSSELFGFQFPCLFDPTGRVYFRLVGSWCVLGVFLVWLGDRGVGKGEQKKTGRHVLRGIRTFC